MTRSELSYQQRRTIDVLEHLVELDLGRLSFAKAPAAGEPVTLKVSGTSSRLNDEDGNFEIVIDHHGAITSPERIDAR